MSRLRIAHYALRIEPKRALALARARVMDGLGGPCPWGAGAEYFLWRPAGTAACLGVSQSPENELRLDACQADGVDIVKRPSGGGAVILSKGVLCWEAWTEEATLGEASGIRPAYRALSEPVLDALAALGFVAEMAGTSDIAVSSRKIAGTAQFRRRGRVWVHGSLLVEADVSAFARWLREPSEAPAYRAGRDHRAFCATLSELSEKPVGVEKAARAIHAAAARRGWRQLTVDS